MLNRIERAREEIALIERIRYAIVNDEVPWLLSVSNVSLKQNTSELTV